LPHFTLQILAEGPMVQAVVGVSSARADALRAAQQPVPQTIPVRALVDTGASCSCVDPSVLTGLALTPTGAANIVTPTTGATPNVTSAYDVLLAIPAAPGQQPAVFPTISVVAVDLLVPQGFHVLIGRDILSDCILVYNGAARFFTLAF
jgi:hypothetical protein